MPNLSTKVPKLSRHARGQAFVKIGGRQIWLGRFTHRCTIVEMNGESYRFRGSVKPARKAAPATTAKA